ncbi:hypothetical protein JI721_07140 [Alicyclobacillus cycloheptanicus]|uniref:Uncharacterized protein n=1 Tax=Alicyclobacillus cycloheptanicus TaxID=1457 RepID=A0ABT9XIS2_9BACL|nr:hypothetical protein [Alicyclobacillus cycloheptanicus]MDQ0190214.1 hypothetical protein [Alicyclobacillus cycloheptanicus]WDM02538.1 hypothetical protein JI721_07140 [Alicyclobacillus cycloheptanicus]
MKSRIKTAISIACGLSVLSISAFAYSGWHHTGTVKAATTGLEIAQLKSVYGLNFIPDNAQATNSGYITADQAVSNVQKLFNTPITTDTMFGSVSTNPNGDGVVAPSSTTAGKLNHGVLSDYPVWVVRISNISTTPAGPNISPDASQSQKDNFESFENSTQNEMYAFVDAKTGEVLFMSTLNG